MNLRKRLPLVVGILVIAWVLVLLSKASRIVPRSAPAGSRTETSVGTEPPAPSEPSFTTYDEAVQYVRAHYSGESIDTRRSSWITSAEYFPAGGRGYLILGMKGRPYIFAGVPPLVWQELKDAPSLGRYYNQDIRGRYRLNLQWQPHSPLELLIPWWPLHPLVPHRLDHRPHERPMARSAVRCVPMLLRS